MFVAFIRLSVIKMFNISAEDLKNRECIVISSDSENESIVRDHPPKKKCAVVSPIQRQDTTSDLAKDNIDEIVRTLSEKLAQKEKKRKKHKTKRKPISRGRSLSPIDTIIDKDESNSLENEDSFHSTRDDFLCGFGLRKKIKKVNLFQFPINCQERKKSLNDSNLLIDENNNQNFQINYLLTSADAEPEKMKRNQEPTSFKTKSREESPTCDNIGLSSVDVDTDKEVLSDKFNKSAKDTNRAAIKVDNTKRRQGIQKVLTNEISLNEMCLPCGVLDDIACFHPLFEGGLCKDHKILFQKWFFTYDQDGCQAYCSVCCEGENVAVCDRSGCGRCFCTNCIELLVGNGEYERIQSTPKWFCYFCGNEREEEGKHLIRKREDWQDKLQTLFSCMESETRHPFPALPPPLAPEEKQPIRVLSLFDGIATGLVALKQLGLEVGKFVASEIDESAIRLVRNRHPGVVHVGDITKFTVDDVIRHGPFDLVMGGSPCNDLSGANPRRRGLYDCEGTGRLFFDFFRILQAARPPRPTPDCSCDAKNRSRPFFWLFENVVSMKLENRDDISRFLSCDPVVADARLVSAASRPRLFWGNLPGLRQLKLVTPPSAPLNVQSCLEPDRVATVEKLNTITTKSTCLYQGSTKLAPVQHLGKDDVLWTTEVERIFGVPEHYTDVNNLGPRERLALLGRSWSVPVVRQILAPLKEYFKSK
ncbi:DNA (cytosine-5)-methyltransferase 3B-like isoform X1 [Clavelina lepadiformis]|uniref:DNA (cytosine-5)-methyltransferase 3B-like isoform X1 n=2 Tax=Clavelina lepadiformis TaxID=159417 RepID=UPI0040421C77